MALLSVIRRWALRDQLSIREIARRTGLSRNTIRKYLRSGAVEPKFKVPDRPSKLDAFAGQLVRWLETEASKPRKQKRTVKQLHADLVALGYEGSYGRVAAFARAWKADWRRAEQTGGRGTFVPLAFAPGEAFQFDSHGGPLGQELSLESARFFRLPVSIGASGFDRSGCFRPRSCVDHSLLAARMASVRRGSRMQSTGEAGMREAHVLICRAKRSCIPGYAHVRNAAVCYARSART